jgi:hypothetical protein
LPFFNIFNFLVAEKPRITKPLRNIEISIGDELRLECLAFSESAPIFEWTKNGILLDENVQVIIIFE